MNKKIIIECEVVEHFQLGNKEIYEVKLPNNKVIVIDKNLTKEKSK
jgi:hypothetical protein